MHTRVINKILCCIISRFKILPEGSFGIEVRASVKSNHVVPKISTIRNINRNVCFRDQFVFKRNLVFLRYIVIRGIRDLLQLFVAGDRQLQYLHFPVMERYGVGRFSYTGVDVHASLEFEIIFQFWHQ